MFTRFLHVVAYGRISLFRLNGISCICVYTTFCLSSQLSVGIWVAFVLPVVNNAAVKRNMGFHFILLGLIFKFD